MIAPNIKTASSEAYILLTNCDGFFLVKIADIIYCENDNSYTTFYTTTRMLVVSKGLCAFEPRLKNLGFMRIHQRYLINPKHLFAIIKGDGAYSAAMSNEVTLPVAIQKRKAVIEALKRLADS